MSPRRCVASASSCWSPNVLVEVLFRKRFGLVDEIPADIGRLKMPYREIVLCPAAASHEHTDHGDDPANAWHERRWPEQPAIVRGLELAASTEAPEAPKLLVVEVAQEPGWAGLHAESVWNAHPERLPLRVGRRHAAKGHRIAVAIARREHRRVVVAECARDLAPRLSPPRRKCRYDPVGPHQRIPAPARGGRSARPVRELRNRGA